MTDQPAGRETLRPENAPQQPSSHCQGIHHDGDRVSVGNTEDIDIEGDRVWFWDSEEETWLPYPPRITTTARNRFPRKEGVAT
jgi:hypothetical protein